MEESELDEIDGMTLRGSYLLMLLKDMECDFSCERGIPCPDHGECHAQLVRAFKEIVYEFYRYEKLITNLVTMNNKLLQRILLYLDDNPPARKKEEADYYG